MARMYAQGFTQREVGERFGVTRAYVGDVVRGHAIRGKRRPSPACRYLDALPVKEAKDWRKQWADFYK